MRAVVLARYGGPEVLQVSDHPDPVLRPDQVIVKVTACGVCGHDLLARAGVLGTPLPIVLGHEIAGVVTEVGGDVEELTEGQRVALVQRIPCGACIDCRRGSTNLCRKGPGFYGENMDGGYAEYVAASPRNAVVLPDQVSDEQGAILSCGVGTGLRALRQAALDPGDLVVITGAGGGVGLHTVVLASVFGYRVLAVTSSEHKRKALLDAGAADVVVSPSPAVLRQTAKDLSGGRGAEAAIEVAGAPTFNASIATLGPGGRLVLVGNTRPQPVEINPGGIIVRELKILGSAHATRDDLAEVVSLVADAKIVPSVSAVQPLEEAADLHRAMEAKEVIGRAVLRVGDRL